MQLKPFKAILSVFVLGFGIISCSKEKEVHYQEEAFKPDRISTQNEDKSVLFDENIKTLQMGRQLIFDSFKNHDFTANPVIFTVESTCRQNGKTETMYGRLDFQNVAKIDVIKIIPEDILATVDQDTALCDFVIVTKNKNGSSNINRLFGVEITNLLKFSNIEPEIVENGRVHFDDRALDDIAVNGRGTVKLACNDFTKTLTGVQDAFTLTRLNITESATLSQLKSSSQTCRIVFKGSFAVQASALFTLDFPVQAAVIRGVVQALPIKSSLTKPNVLRVEITNQNLFPIKMRIAKSKSTRFVFRPIYMRGAYPVIGRLQRSAVEFKSYADGTTSDAINIFFTVHPGKTAIVDSIATRNLICEGGIQSVVGASPINALSPANTTALYAGNNYDYEMNSKFMFDRGNNDWEEVEVSLIGKTHDSLFSDLPYWNWPSNEQIKSAFGQVVDVWSNMTEGNDVCN